MDDIGNTVLFIATKYQEIYPPDLEAQAQNCSTSKERMLELEAEILASLDYRIQPTIELSIIGILKAELDLKVPSVYRKLDQNVRKGVYTGILRESNIISTLFGMVHAQSRHLSTALNSKCERICNKYGIDIQQARLDFMTFANLLSSYKSAFKECYDLLSN